MTHPKAFKDAIAQLPSSEKDKLILRLLKKDLALTNRLYFELLSTNTVEDNRNELITRLKSDIKRSAEHFSSLYQLNIDIKTMSGSINEHVYTTKDKLGEISLNLYLMIQVLQQNHKQIQYANPYDAPKFYEAFVNRIFKTLTLISKLHEDYKIEFSEDLETLGHLIEQNPMFAAIAKRKSLGLEWLFGLEIPKDIYQIQKEARNS